MPLSSLICVQGLLVPCVSFPLFRGGVPSAQNCMNGRRERWDSEWSKNVLPHTLTEYLLSIHSVAGTVSAPGMSHFGEQNGGPILWSFHLAREVGSYQISEVCWPPEVLSAVENSLAGKGHGGCLERCE